MSTHTCRWIALGWLWAAAFTSLFIGSMLSDRWSNENHTYVNIHETVVKAYPPFALRFRPHAFVSTNTFEEATRCTAAGESGANLSCAVWQSLNDGFVSIDRFLLLQHDRLEVTVDLNQWPSPHCLEVSLEPLDALEAHKNVRGHFVLACPAQQNDLYVSLSVFEETREFHVTSITHELEDSNTVKVRLQAMHADSRVRTTTLVEVDGNRMLAVSISLFVLNLLLLGSVCCLLASVGMGGIQIDPLLSREPLLIPVRGA